MNLTWNVIPSSDRPGPWPWPKSKPPALAEICPKSAGVLQNFFPKMYIIILENEVQSYEGYHFLNLGNVGKKCVKSHYEYLFKKFTLTARLQLFLNFQIVS